MTHAQFSPEGLISSLGNCKVKAVGSYAPEIQTMQTHMTDAQAACPNHIRHFSCYRRSSERLTYAGAVMAALGSASCLIWLNELVDAAYRPSVGPYFFADFGNREWVWASNLLAHEESAFEFYVWLTRTYSHYQG